MRDQAELSMKIILVGATGYLGPRLAGVLQSVRHEVTVVTRDATLRANRLPEGVRVVGVKDYEPAALQHVLQGTDAVVNLAGANIGKGRWTRRRKALLLSSRVETTTAIVLAMSYLGTDERPSVFVSTSGIDYYGNSVDGTVTEDSPSGDSFMARLCVEWEGTARQAESMGVRVVTMRMGTVMGRGARALQLRLLPFRFFMGGPFRPGKQWFCWVHLDDALDLYRFAIEHHEVRGSMNVVAPGVLRESEAATAIGRAIHRPSWLPVPASFLKLAMGEQADLLLLGRHAEPVEALRYGYRFQYPEFEMAIRQILG